jgi:hypothetical protein
LNKNVGNVLPALKNRSTSHHYYQTEIANAAATETTHLRSNSNSISTAASATYSDRMKTAKAVTIASSEHV